MWVLTETKDELTVAGSAKEYRVLSIAQNSKNEYDIHFKASLQNRQMDKMKYEWWKDEPSGPDDEFDY